MKAVATFSVTHEQTCVCVCNGVSLTTQTLLPGENTVESEINNLQTKNNLRYYFLNNTDTVEFTNFSIDDLDFRGCTNALFTHRFTDAVAVDKDGAKHEDSVYKGHQLNSCGYYKIIFDLPIENWFFRTLVIHDE